MTDSSASSDCSSTPLWPGGSALFLFFSQDYLYSFSCRWVSEESGPSTEKETCRVTLQRPSCPLPKLWMGPPPESPPTEAWRSDMWGSNDCWEASGGNLTLPSALWTADLQTQTYVLQIIQLWFLKEGLLGRTVSVSFASRPFQKG